MTKQSSWNKYKENFGKELTARCMSIINLAVERQLITKDEWENRFKDYCDDAGHSFVHYLEAIMAQNIDTFVTENEVMINNCDELNKRFKIKILSLKEMMMELKK